VGRTCSHLEVDSPLAVLLNPTVMSLDARRTVAVARVN